MGSEGNPKADIDGIVDTLLRLSAMVCNHPEIAECDNQSVDRSQPLVQAARSRQPHHAAKVVIPKIIAGLLQVGLAARKMPIIGWRVPSGQRCEGSNTRSSAVGSSPSIFLPKIHERDLLAWRSPRMTTSESASWRSVPRQTIARYAAPRACSRSTSRTLSIAC